MPTKICAWCGQPFTTHVHQTLQMAGVFGRNSQREHSTSDSLPPTPKEVHVLSQLALIAKTARRQKTEMCTRKGHAYRGQSEHAAPPLYAMNSSPPVQPESRKRSHLSLGKTTRPHHKATAAQLQALDLWGNLLRHTNNCIAPVIGPPTPPPSRQTNY